MKSASTCNEVRQQSAAYFANDLSPLESQRLEQHLADCARCRLELSEAYSGYRLATAAFHAPDAVGGLNAARLGAIYAAAANGSGTMPVTRPRHELRKSWFAAAAMAVIASAAWMGQPLHEAPSIAEAPVHAAAAPAATEVVESFDLPDSGITVASYPASYGLIYPMDYRAAGGFTMDSVHATVNIDYDSLYDHSLFIYDPAYGMGRTVVSDGAHLTQDNVPADYGLDGPKGHYRL